MDSLDFGEVVSRFYFHIFYVVQISSVDVNLRISNIIDCKNYQEHNVKKEERKSCNSMVRSCCSDLPVLPIWLY